MLFKFNLCLVCTFLLTGSGMAQHTELGDVQWLRNMDDALVAGRKDQKPVLILFQEIPGCATCKNYGNQVLTHPLLVEIIETEFIPLAIYNNKGGHDAEILKRYNEPAWNNPVVRIVDEQGRNIVARLSGNYTTAGLAGKLREALIQSSGKAPDYVHLLATELTSQQRGTAQATYSMYCFWTGEALFGRISGVVKTTAGFQNGKEVVSVEYDPTVVTRAELDKIAASRQCSAEAGGTFRKDSTPKYYLSKSKYRAIPMTELQKCRVNSALAEGQNPDPFLSPRQLRFLNSNNNANYVEETLIAAWREGMNNE